MDDSNDHERAAILARRALLLSSALASLSCSAPGEPGPQQAATSASADVSVPLPPTSTAGPAAKPTVKPLPSWDDVLKSAPNSTVPASISAAGRSSFEGFAKQLDAPYAAVKALWDSEQGLCDPKAPECREAWRKLGQALSKARDAIGDLRPGLCHPGFSPPSLGKRVAEQQAFLSARLAEAEAHYTELSAAYGPLSEHEWLKHVAASKVSPPMPCLSCAAMKPYPVHDVLEFPSGSAALDDPQREALKSLAKRMAAEKNPTPMFEVWGHAEGSEKDADALAKKRAEVVMAELHKHGVDKASMQVVAIGAGLTAAGAKGRVEFVARTR